MFEEVAATARLLRRLTRSVTISTIYMVITTFSLSSYYWEGFRHVHITRGGIVMSAPVESDHIPPIGYISPELFGFPILYKSRDSNGNTATTGVNSTGFMSMPYTSITFITCILLNIGDTPRGAWEVIVSDILKHLSNWRRHLSVGVAVSAGGSPRWLRTRSVTPSGRGKVWLQGKDGDIIAPFCNMLSCWDGNRCYLFHRQLLYNPHTSAGLPEKGTVPGEGVAS